MAKPLNFNKVQKHYLNVTLADENNTMILIGTPTKAVMDDIKRLQDKMNHVTDDDATSEDMDELYGVCAQLMSRNKTGAKITSDFLATIFDLEDVKIFIDAYMEFLDEVLGSKN